MVCDATAAQAIQQQNRQHNSSTGNTTATQAIKQQHM
jgi:hypothetical protein